MKTPRAREHVSSCQWTCNADNPAHVEDLWLGTYIRFLLALEANKATPRASSGLSLSHRSLSEAYCVRSSSSGGYWGHAPMARAREQQEQRMGEVQGQIQTVTFKLPQLQHVRDSCVLASLLGTGTCQVHVARGVARGAVGASSRKGGGHVHTSREERCHASRGLKVVSRISTPTKV